MTDSNTNSQQLPPPESLDNYHSFGSNPPPPWQDSTTPRFRGQGHYQGPYPTSNPRMRQRGDFQQRGRYFSNKRGGTYRPQNREKNFDQQQDQSLDNHQYQTNPSNRNFNKFFRPTMLEDPWSNMKPQKVPSDGTSLVFDSTNH